MADVLKVVTDAEAVYADYQAKNVTKGMADAEALVADVQTAITDCTKSDNVFTKLYNDIPVKAASSAACMTDVMKLVADAEAVYADVQAKNVTKGIADAETLVTDVK